MKDTMTKEIKVEFAPGCFDAFEGTQEELNDLMAEIQRLAESGELFEEGNIVDVEELDDEEFESMQAMISKSQGRTLQ